MRKRQSLAFGPQPQSLSDELPEIDRPATLDFGHIM